jgi:hypothetical protein
MAVHNGERFLREAILSILNQTYTDFELLVVDDASTDSTAGIIASFADPRIRVLKNDTNLGLTRSLNIGLREARGEYVARMDADDVSLPERLAAQVTYLGAHPEVALLGTRAVVIDDSGNFIRETEMMASLADAYFRLQLDNVFVHSSVMFRLDAAVKAGAYDDEYRLAQDYDLWLRLASVHNIDILPSLLLRWRRSLSGLSVLESRSQTEAANRIRIKQHAQLLAESPRDWSTLMARISATNTSRISLSDLLHARNLFKQLVDVAPKHLVRTDLQAVANRVFVGLVKRWALQLSVIHTINSMRHKLSSRLHG